VEWTLNLQRDICTDYYLKNEFFYCSYRVFPVWLNCLKHCRKFTTFFLHFFWICPNGDKSQILDTWKNQNFLSSEIEKLTILHNTGTNTTTRCISHENYIYIYIFKCTCMYLSFPRKCLCLYVEQKTYLGVFWWSFREIFEYRSYWSSTLINVCVCVCQSIHPSISPITPKRWKLGALNFAYIRRELQGSAWMKIWWLS